MPSNRPTSIASVTSLVYNLRFWGRLYPVSGHEPRVTERLSTTDSVCKAPANKEVPMGNQLTFGRLMGFLDRNHKLLGLLLSLLHLLHIGIAYIPVRDSGRADPTFS